MIQTLEILKKEVNPIPGRRIERLFDEAITEAAKIEKKIALYDKIDKAVSKFYEDADDSDSMGLVSIGEEVANILGYL